MKKVKTVLISVFHKDGLLPLLEVLANNNCRFISTGGTAEFIRKAGYQVIEVASLTGYPSILGGRVKTLHPTIFGGILARQSHEEDSLTLKKYNIPYIDMVVVDLYPFEETVHSGASHEEIIEKIDIGGISLIRAAAKNYKDVVCISHQNQYPEITRVLQENNGKTDENFRRKAALQSFAVSAHYDSMISKYISHLIPENEPVFRESFQQTMTLRYGENPHQKGYYFGNLEEIFDKFNGKDLSYNNLLDIDAAVRLMEDLDKNIPAFAILKHNNACGLSIRPTVLQAYRDALAGDPVSAFGGILISNHPIDIDSAREIHKLFFEVIIAPAYKPEALSILKQKKNRIILKKKTDLTGNKYIYRTALNGVLYQERDAVIDDSSMLQTVTRKKADSKQIEDLLFASVIAKHSKSNTIVLVKNKQLLAAGVGQTSRIDALQQAIEKAKHFGFDLTGAVMASDAFFPFPDSVEMAHLAGITAVIQPGGSIKDNLSIEYCDTHNVAMVFTGKRHFKH